MSVHTELLPELDDTEGPFVKVTTDGHALYVKTLGGRRTADPLANARELILGIAEELTATPEMSTVGAEVVGRQYLRSRKPASGAGDLDDQLEIGLKDSFPASDPPAAATRTTLPKTRKK